MLIDPFGLDSAQRQQAIQKALEYVEMNPGDTYDYAAKGEPGQDVDCSGMTSAAIVAGGESDPVQSAENGEQAVETYGVDGGVRRTAVGTTEITNYNDVKPGMLVAFDAHSHIGLVTNIELNKDGSIQNLQYIDSGGTRGSGNSGPRFSSAISNGENMGKNISGIYKWDTKPDPVKVNLPVSVRDNTRIVN